MRSFRVAVALFFFLISLIPACSPRNESFPSLSNKGILPLSTVDSHLGSNLFLAKEMEKSSYLFNFLKSRGAPMAIEIVEPLFSRPRLLLFYPREKEVYAADIQQEERSRQWIVRGPFSIERKDYRELMGLEASFNGVPVFVVWNKEYRFQQTPTVKVVTALQPVLPTPVPAPRRRVVHKKKAATTTASEPQLTSNIDPFYCSLDQPRDV